MIIKEGSAEDIHNWFITEKSDEIVLCIFLGRSDKDILLLSNLIDRATQIDSIIGEKVGFLLCATGMQSASSVNGGSGGVNVIGGAYKRASRNTVVARDFISSFDMERLRRGGYPADREYYRQASEALARSTARLVPDFMEMYGVTHRELPCVVTLVKGVHTFNITHSPSDLSPESLITWLTKVRKIVDQVERDLLLKNFCATEIQHRINSTKAYEAEAYAKLAKIEKAATGICRKYAKSTENALPVVSSLSSRDLNIEEKKRVMCRFMIDYPEAKQDNRWSKILALLKRIEELRSSELGALDRDALKSLSDRLQDEFEKLGKIYEAVTALKMPNSSSRAADRGATPRRPQNYWETVDRVNTASDMMEKTITAIKFIGRLIAIGS